MIERAITSISDYLDALRDNHDPESGATWYRGHARSDWTLLPGFMRITTGISETTLLNRFRQSAAMLADKSPRNSFDWMFLMQHYGVPTRLLDWSESPLVALYFAVDEFNKHPDADATVWCLKPTLLNRNANIVDKVEGSYIPSFEDDELKSYATESVRQNARIELLPVATIATRNNPRIQAQMGMFTIHHNKQIAIEDVGDQSHVAKYLIPDKSRAALLKELRL
jgi:hypothetical protein